MAPNTKNQFANWSYNTVEKKGNYKTLYAQTVEKKFIEFKVLLILMHATESKLSYFYYHLVYNQTIHVTISCFNVFTYTVRACFHLGLCVLLHFSVLFDWPSTATSTYGLGPNQFFLFSFSFAEITSQL